jgi:uncharacterized membrane protein YeaQ/YmgE (transglycosylase-associated protein family)
MDILTLVIVGLLAGVLASFIVRGSGLGILGDIVVGIGGAFLGSYIFVRAGWHAPLEGIAGTVLVSTFGAVILLVLVHVVQSGSRRRV